MTARPTVHMRDRRRPKGVVAVVVLSVVQAVLLLLVGVALAVARDEVTLEGGDALTPDNVLVVGIVLAAFGSIEIIVAVFLARGSDMARSIFGIVNTLHVAAGVYGLVAMRDVQVATLWSLALAVGVLWFLYGSRQAQEYFGS